MSSKQPAVMLMSAITSIWLIYDIATATERPGPMLAFLQYGLLALTLVSLVGAAVMYARER